MELEHGCQELQKRRISNTDYTHSHCLPDYIIDRFMRSLQVRESPPRSRFPPNRSHATCTPDTTEDLLKQLRLKLEMVERDRYIMQQMARIENCRFGMDHHELKRIQWYHYSGCPKKYI